MDAQSANAKKRATKSRNGCVNCKRRRVKCDEAQPTCSRCRVRGETCAYNTPQPWIFQPSNTPSTATSGTASPPQPQRSLSSPMIDPSGDYALQFFHRCLAQFADNAFFLNDGGFANVATIVRHRSTEVACTNLLNAVTTAWRAAWDASWAHNKQYEQYYTQCLNKGIKVLLEAGRFQQPRASTLHCQQIVAIAELIRTGDYLTQGPFHRSVWALIRQLEQQYPGADDEEKIQIEHALKHFPTLVEGSKQVWALPQLEYHTHSPAMAADILFTLLRFWVIGIVRLEHIGESWIKSPEPANVWGMLESWKESFDTFCSATTAPEPGTEASARLYEMHHDVAQLIIRNYAATSARGLPLPFSIWNPLEDATIFNRILDLAEPLAASPQLYRLARGFDQHLGLLQPLFYAALRSADAGIRRRAVEILRNLNISEQDWNSRVAYRIAETMAGILDASTVPVSSKVHPIFVIDSATCSFQKQDSGMSIVALEIKYAMVFDIMLPQRVWQRKTVSYWEKVDLEAFQAISWPLTYTVKTFGYAKSDTIPYIHGTTDVTLRNLIDAKHGPSRPPFKGLLSASRLH